MLQIQGVSIRKIAEVRAGAAVTGAVGVAAFSKSRDQSSRGTRVWHLRCYLLPSKLCNPCGRWHKEWLCKQVSARIYDNISGWSSQRAQGNENKETGYFLRRLALNLLTILLVFKETNEIARRLELNYKYIYSSVGDSCTHRWSTNPHCISQRVGFDWIVDFDSDSSPWQAQQKIIAIDMLCVSCPIIDIRYLGRVWRLHDSVPQRPLGHAKGEK